MPNWCEGTLKVRGTVDELMNFVKGALRPTSVNNAHLDIKEYKDCVGFEAHDKGEYFIEDEFWLEDTRRHFVMPTEICVQAETKEQKVVLLLPFREAWGIDAESLRDLCTKYRVDMRITGFEFGMQFQQEVEIVGGKILRDYCIKYADCDWECPCPLRGG